jgi:hypothetical protein
MRFPGSRGEQCFRTSRTTAQPRFVSIRHGMGFQPLLYLSWARFALSVVRGWCAADLWPLPSLLSDPSANGANPYNHDRRPLKYYIR